MWWNLLQSIDYTPKRGADGTGYTSSLTVLDKKLARTEKNDVHSVLASCNAFNHGSNYSRPLPSPG